MKRKMDWRTKIKTRQELARIVAEQRARGKKIVLCHGCFDILHPGHVRHLAWAKQQGDVLVVTVSSDAVVQKGPGWPFVPQELRAENLAAIEFVDYVAVDDGQWAGPILELLKPDVYVKGKEFEHVYTGRIGRERALVQSYGGRVLFSSGDVVYSSTAIYRKERLELGLPDERLRRFRQRNGVLLQDLEKLLEAGDSGRVVVVGDIPVLREVRCAATGGRSSAPFKTAERRCRPSGTWEVASALQRLGAAVTLLGVVGEDRAADYLADQAGKTEMEVRLLRDPTRPTACIERFVQGRAVLFETHEYEGHPPEPGVEERLVDLLDRFVPGSAAVVVVDYGAGTIGESIVAEVRMRSRFSEAASLGFTDPFDGFPDLTRLEGLEIVLADEAVLRLSLCDGTSGVAEIAARAVRAVRCRHLAICLPDGGVLLLRPPRRPEKHPAESDYELRTSTPTDYLPCYGPHTEEPPVTAAALLGPLAFGLSRGGSFMASAYTAVAACCVAASTHLKGEKLREAVLDYLISYSLLPDEQAEVRPGRVAVEEL